MPSQTCSSGQFTSATSHSCLGICAKTPLKAGYMKTPIQQLLRADRAVWAQIIEDNVSVRRDATGLCPLDAAVPAALHSPLIAFHLVPLPIHQPKNEWKAKQWGKDDEWKNKQWNKWQPYDPKKSKGKGKGVRTNMVPKVFKHKHCVCVDHHGRRLCFGYNLKKCTQVSDGARCHNAKVPRASPRSRS